MITKEEENEVLEVYKQYKDCRLTEVQLIEALDKINYQYTRWERINYLAYVDKLFEATVQKNKNLVLNTKGD